MRKKSSACKMGLTTYMGFTERLERSEQAVDGDGIFLAQATRLF